MPAAKQKTRITGKYVVSSTVGETYKAFHPKPLPPDPPLAMQPGDHELMEKANLALGRLDGLTTLIPDTSLFIYMYVRKEALLSSQIEGTQSSLSDLLLYESEQVPGVPLEDVREVSQYVAALDFGLRRIRDGFPVSNRLIRDIHEVLLSKGRGSSKTPGEFRRTQNWIGGTRPGNAHFVPPLPELVTDCMSDLEKYINRGKAPILLKAALSHVQFETIHPFLDGNGRLGRLLITLLLCAEGALTEPLLYLSLYFKSNRDTYYDLLDRVRTKGDWEGWVRFFFSGVLETSERAARTTHALLKLFEEDRRKIEGLGRPASSALKVHELLKEKLIISIPKASSDTGITRPTVASSVRHLEKLKVVREFTGRERGRLYVYDKYLEILQEGTEPL